MPYQLGIDPDTLTVDLYRDAEFTSSLTLKDGSTWPGVVELRFPGDATVWTAVVSDSTATWSESADAAATRTHGEAVELWVGDACWAAGRVQRRGA